MTPHLPEWATQLLEALAGVLTFAGAVVRAYFTPSPRERALEAALYALKGAHPMQFDLKKTIAILPLVPEAFGIEQEIAAGELDDAAKSEALLERIAKDVSAAFAAEGASPAIVAALGNVEVYREVNQVREMIQNAIPSLESLFASLTHKQAPAEPAPAA